MLVGWSDPPRANLLLIWPPCREHVSGFVRLLPLMSFEKKTRVSMSRWALRRSLNYWFVYIVFSPTGLAFILPAVIMSLKTTCIWHMLRYQGLNFDWFRICYVLLFLSLEVGVCTRLHCRIQQSLVNMLIIEWIWEFIWITSFIKRIISVHVNAHYKNYAVGLIFHYLL